MAEFFDQKQEVMSIELTKHGRKMLGLGIFQPEYYEFFDDTVIYDQNYCGLNENQNNIKDRILDNSITLKSLNNTEDILKNPLGSSKTTSDYAPAWDLQILRGNIERTAQSSSYYENEFIINSSSLEYKISLETKDVTNLPNYNFSNFELEDGRIITVLDEYVLIDLKELNMEDDYENFEIEIVTYDALAGGKDGGLERRLYFQPKQTNIFDGLIYSEDELPSKFTALNIDKNDVSYYLDILVDNEIDRNIITQAAQTVKEQVKPTYTTTFEGSAKEDC
jgi:hypothetical protein